MPNIFTPFKLLLISSPILFWAATCQQPITRSYLVESDIIYNENDGQPIPKPGNPDCNNYKHYIPDSSDPSTLRVRRVKVNIHFMNNKAGTVNFSEVEGTQYAIDLIYAANQMLKNNQKMNLPLGNNTPVVQPMYQFTIWPDPAVAGDNGIYFHYDDDLWYMNKKNRGATLFSSKHYDTYGKQKGEVINVFLMEHPTDSITSATYKASADGVGYSVWAKIVGCYQHTTEIFYWEGNKPIYKGAWFLAKLFNHELGHTLGLPHSWNANDGCDDTPLNPNCWNYTSSPPCDKELSNNMMDYNQCQCALSPCQIGKIRYYMSQDNFTQRKFLVKDWCERNPAFDIQIYAGDTTRWIGNKDIQGNITIQNGGVLEISCTISLPRDARIIVKQGATLILNNCRITNTCGDQWEGIEVWQKGIQKGRVIAIGKPQLLQVKNPVFKETDPKL